MNSKIMHIKKSKKKKLLVISLSVLAILILAAFFTFICNYLVNESGKNGLLYYEFEDNLVRRDYVIVPGAAVQDGMPSAPLQTRLDRAIQLYESGTVSFILVSGGSEETPVMHKYLLYSDIPNSDIQVDQYGVDTYDTIVRASETFAEKTFYFTTQEQYSARPTYIINNLKIDSDCINSDLIFYKWEKRDFAREYFAKTKAVLDSFFIKSHPDFSIDDYPIITGEMNEKNIDYSDNPHNIK